MVSLSQGLRRPRVALSTYLAKNLGSVLRSNQHKTEAKSMFWACSLEVNVRTLPSIMSDLGLAHVDIVKIDVEGSEFAFLSQVREIEPESRKIGQKRPKRGIICLLTLSWLSRLRAGAPALRRAGAAVPGRSAGSGGAPLHTKPAVRRSSLAGGGGARTAP